MSRFENTNTGVVVSVDDSKDDRFASELWQSADESKPKRTARKSAAKSDSSDSDN